MKIPIILTIIVIIAILITASLIPIRSVSDEIAELRENDRYFNNRLSHVEKRVVDFSEPIAVNKAREAGRGK